MFLDESAFDMDDDVPSSRSNNRSSYNSGSRQHYGGNNNNDLALVLDEDMEDLSLGSGGLGSAGGIGTSSASRARFLAQQRDISLKKQQQKMTQSGMIRSVDSPAEISGGQFTPSVKQFSAPKIVREAETDFSRGSNSRQAEPFSPEKTTTKSRRALEEVDYDAPKSRSDRGDRRNRDRSEDRESRRQTSSRGNDDDYDRKKTREPPSGRRGDPRRDDWEEEDYARRDKYKRRDDDYDYQRDSRPPRSNRDRGESRRGDGERRRPKDEGSSDEERYRRDRNRSRSPPNSRSTRRRDDYEDPVDDRRRDKERDDYRDERRGGRERSKRREEYDEDYERTRGDRERERRPKADLEDDRERDTIEKKGKSSRSGGWHEGREMVSGDEDSEAPEKWAAAGRDANGMVGPGNRADRNTGPPPAMPSVELDLSDMTRFLMRPLPRGAGIVQCHIVRNKSGTNKLYPIYSLYLKDNDRFLMCSKKRPNNKTSNYLISKKENDLARDSPNYLGKLRSNFVGTEFQVFDNGSSPDDDEHAGQDTRRELGAITYAPNVLGSRGPRKMQAVIPAVDESNTIVSWRQTKGSEGEMLQRIKDRNFKDLCYFINKPPRWNEQVGAYVLNFSGRVTMASVKNFQLVDPDEQNAIVLQFGRVGKDQFTMDMQWPMSPFQAFAITLSSFDSKIACD